MQTPIQVNATLSRLDSFLSREEPTLPALICLNDDIQWQPEIMRSTLGSWMQGRWPTKATWEV